MQWMKTLSLPCQFKGLIFSEEDHGFRLGVDADARSIPRPHLRTHNMQITDQATSLSWDNLHYSLLGYLIDDKEVDDKAMQNYMTANWSVYTRVLHYDRNFFVIKFASRSELPMILDNGPYAIEGGLLILRCCYDDEDLVLDGIKIDKLSIWVRMHRVPISMLNYRGVADLARRVGEVAIIKEDCVSLGKATYVRAKPLYTSSLRAHTHKKKRSTFIPNLKAEQMMEYYSRVLEFYVQDGFTITDLEEDERVPWYSTQSSGGDDNDSDDDSNPGGHDDANQGDDDDDYQADINADNFYNDDLPPQNGLLPTYQMRGPSEAISLVYYDPSRMAALAAEDFPPSPVMHSESEQNAQPTVLPDLSSEGTPESFHSFNSNHFYMPQSFYTIPENAPPENRLDDLDFVLDLFIPNVPDFPPFDEVTSPVFVLHAAFDDFVIDREKSICSLHSTEIATSDNSTIQSRERLLEKFLSVQLSSVNTSSESSAYSDSSVEPLISPFQSSVIASPSTKSSATIRNRSFSHFTKGSQGWTMSAPAWEDLTDSDSEDSVIQYRMTVQQAVSDPETIPAQVIKKPRGSLKTFRRRSNQHSLRRRRSNKLTATPKRSTSAWCMRIDSDGDSDMEVASDGSPASLKRHSEGSNDDLQRRTKRLATTDQETAIAATGGGASNSVLEDVCKLHGFAMVVPDQPSSPS
ncbi:OLC1v1005277C1 [Oldenlandia corymbosa var. corymbosa]|uniref:OLC1v1005277C1 n=1 Tax=Oldenlandia corymbosa var. corymbosa TaxID=529605 RepID=A0AAV1DE82_OLDCO|nr:OLC1v1005277C1 [Oldenlandia corymbosa var. corymbosa]